MPFTISEALRAAAREHGDRPFLTGAEGPLSFGDLDRLADRCATGLLARGIASGDRIAVAGLNRADWLVLFFAATRIGVSVVTLNVRYRESELRYMLDQSGARLVITEPSLPAGPSGPGFDFRALYAQLMPSLRTVEAVCFFDADGADSYSGLVAVDIDGPAVAAAESGPHGDTPAVILYTSGTTGQPKGAVLTNASLLSAASAQQQRMATGPDDVIVATLPFNHVGGITCTVLHMLIAGGRVALIPAFSPAAALRAVGECGGTVLAGVPTMFVLMLAELAAHGADRIYDTSTVRIAVAGGSNVDPSLAAGMARAFPGATVVNLYGLSETSGACVISPMDDDLATVSETLGTTLIGVEERVVDPVTGALVAHGEDGELQIRGTCVAAGYWDLPEHSAAAFDADGWLGTGDVVTRRPDGHLVLRGRLKEMYLQGGYNVYPVEVENVLAAHPEVAMVGGIGIPDEVLGEVGRYFVVPRNLSAPPTSDQLIGWCEERLANYKVPRRIDIRTELPMTPAGKIAKAQLRAQVIEALQRPEAHQ